MAKDKSSATGSSKASKAAAKAAAKAERKAAKHARKVEKLAKKGGVTKSKSKKEKEVNGKKDLEKKKARAERALDEIEAAKDAEDDESEEDEDVKDTAGDEVSSEEEEDTTMNGAGGEDSEEDDDDEGEDEEGEEKGEAVTSLKNAKPEAHPKKEGQASVVRPVGALVPFANPLADEKVAKKVFKSVKKAAAHRTLKRGVKEVVKALRKSPSSQDNESLPVGIVILAADISPMDVISHIPVLAEDHHIPYIYVTSRAELGIAGMTKRPTSVVMVSRDVGKKAADKKDKDKGPESETETWAETYKGLVKVVEREGRHVKV
ncbi:hypothetical protein G647_08507 [Cladophialophora carrionii CBS 160.54]|uniref:Ribosomal protein eL8/eL30/eS12/Gadd45 domain-containing protein n=1 Tax=Cladophialophora carrionii CBS 160.54 TaxID=1279043 RepID=V9D0R1_9EURO|nr:uncharacterized protein G647_08507 [Cladophialophora carrionii CBS 160.54]ETI20470.1 hypothetical protein G647_08507 [Cladophialophora carrionii CBS 160.54]